MQYPENFNQSGITYLHNNIYIGFVLYLSSSYNIVIKLIIWTNVTYKQTC